MKIGQVQLTSNLFLSPLAGYTNLPFRLTVREIGGLGFVTTDLVNARSLLESNPVAVRLSATCPEDQPMSVQLFGADPGEMREAARAVRELGAAAVDVNMGCPVPKVCKVGGGSAMMMETKKTAALIRGMADAVDIPVTVKMRLGWDDQNITAPDLARALEDAGAAAVFVHGRTRQQGFSGRVSLEGIRAVARAVRAIPVIGNGDVTTPEAARVMLEETGCAGGSIGRGAFYNPWIFSQTRHYLKTGEMPPEAALEERLAIMGRHLDRMVLFYGEARGCRMFRRVAKMYSRRFGPANLFNRRVSLLRSRAEFDEIVEEFLAWRRRFLNDEGELLPQFQPRPLNASFLAGEGGADAEEPIKVPAGPIETW